MFNGTSRTEIEWLSDEMRELSAELRRAALRLPASVSSPELYGRLRDTARWILDLIGGNAEPAVLAAPPYKSRVDRYTLADFDGGS